MSQPVDSEIAWTYAPVVRISAIKGEKLNFISKSLYAAALVLATMTGAQADNLLTSIVTKAQVFNSAGSLALNSNGSFTVDFVANSGTRVMVSFSAECSTSGLTNQYTSIEISIDGTSLPPTTGTDDAFCSAGGSTSFKDHLLTATVVTSALLGPTNQFNTHNVTMRVTPMNGGTSRIDDLSLQIWN